MPDIAIDPVKMLQFVQVTSTFGKRALEELGVHRGREKRANDVRAGVLQQLLDGGLIAEHQKEAAAKILADPAESLKLLGKAAAELTKYKTASEKQASTLGQGVDDPAAPASTSYDSIKSPFVGMRTSQKKASDIAFEKALGTYQG